MRQILDFVGAKEITNLIPEMRCKGDSQPTSLVLKKLGGYRRISPLETANNRLTCPAVGGRYKQARDGEPRL